MGTEPQWGGDRVKQAGAPKRMGRRADGAPRRRVTRLEEDSRPHRRKGQAAREVRGSKRGLCEGAGFAGAGAGVQLGEPEAGAVTGLGSEKPAVWGPWRLLGAWTQGSGDSVPAVTVPAKTDWMTGPRKGTSRIGTHFTPGATL